jgi:hypothetical protein
MYRRPSIGIYIEVWLMYPGNISIDVLVLLKDADYIDQWMRDNIRNIMPYSYENFPVRFGFYYDPRPGKTILRVECSPELATEIKLRFG